MKDGKWKKLLATTLGVGMAAALSLGIFTACTDTSKDDEDEDAPAAKTDTQLIKNGDFEFYSESTKTGTKPTAKRHIFLKNDAIASLRLRE